jgi:hypothetical protein
VNFESIIKKNRRNFIGGHTTTTTKNEKRIYKFLSRNKNPKIKKKIANHTETTSFRFRLRE